MNYRLCQIAKLRVVRDDGKSLGRLIDVRVRMKVGPVDRSESVAVDALLVGNAGWLERLGLRDSGEEFPANAALAVEKDRIVVRSAKAVQAGARSKRKRR